MSAIRSDQSAIPTLADVRHRHPVLHGRAQRGGRHGHETKLGHCRRRMDGQTAQPTPARAAAGHHACGPGARRYRADSHMLIITVPPMAASFFQGTLGNFMHYSAFGGSGVNQWKIANGMPGSPQREENTTPGNKQAP